MEYIKVINIKTNDFYSKLSEHNNDDLLKKIDRKFNVKKRSITSNLTLISHQKEGESIFLMKINVDDFERKIIIPVKKTLDIDKIEIIRDEETKKINRIKTLEKLFKGIFNKNSRAEITKNEIVFEIKPNEENIYNAIKKIIKNNNISPDVTNSSEIPFKKEDKLIGFNKIIYGPPGTGKSYKINEEIKRNSFIRTTFHPEYSYGDFIGQIKPIIREDGNPSYKYIPGKLLEAIEKASKDTNKNFYLIIEEINRGNCAAIFGDAFQMLDRDDNGESVYGVRIHGYKDEDIKLPANLIIYATMNTSDQNLFPMDSAFKRRWDMEYINSENNNESEIKLNTKDLEKKIKNKLYEYLYNDALKNERNKIFKDNKENPLRFSEIYNKSLIEIAKMLQAYVKTSEPQTLKEILTWNDLRLLVNEAIYKCTKKEDKEIGKFFIKGIDENFKIN